MWNDSFVVATSKMFYVHWMKCTLYAIRIRINERNTVSGQLNKTNIAVSIVLLQLLWDENSWTISKDWPVPYN